VANQQGTHGRLNRPGWRKVRQVIHGLGIHRDPQLRISFSGRKEPAVVIAPNRLNPSFAQDFATLRDGGSLSVNVSDAKNTIHATRVHGRDGSFQEVDLAMDVADYADIS
jgi:hypothetical protein